MKRLVERFGVIVAHLGALGLRRLSGSTCGAAVHGRDMSEQRRLCTLGDGNGMTSREEASYGNEK